MKQLNSNFTTPEQSRRLLDLGLPADSADCFYKEPYTVVNVLRNCDEFSYYCGDIDRNVDYLKYTPCWSVGRLIEIYRTCWTSNIKWDCIFEQDDNIMEYLIFRLEHYHNHDMLDFSKLED